MKKTISAPPDLERRLSPFAQILHDLEAHGTLPDMTVFGQLLDKLSPADMVGLMRRAGRVAQAILEIGLPPTPLTAFALLALAVHSAKFSQAHLEEVSALEKLADLAERLEAAGHREGEGQEAQA